VSAIRQITEQWALKAHSALSLALVSVTLSAAVRQVGKITMDTKLIIGDSDQPVQIVHTNTSWVVIVNSLGIRVILCPYVTPEDRESIEYRLPSIASTKLAEVGSLPALYFPVDSATIYYGFFGDWETRQRRAHAIPLTRGECAAWVEAVWQDQASPIGLSEIEEVTAAFAADRDIAAWVEWEYLCEIADQSSVPAES